jgi:transposase-like protein
MFDLDEYAQSTGIGKVAISCPFCKASVFNPIPLVNGKEARLQWYCVHCQAKFTSKPPANEIGETKASYKEKLILRLLEQGNCENIVKIYAVASKRPPIFLEEKLRELLNDL